MKEPLLIDSKALAEILQVKYSTVRQWSSQKRIPGAVKINGCRRFVYSEILRWVDELKEGKYCLTSYYRYSIFILGKVIYGRGDGTWRCF